MSGRPEETVQRSGGDFEVALVHLEPLRRMARRLCGNRADADDLVQETYLAALRHFDQFRPGTNCRAWLFTILRNRFINHARQQGRWVLAVDGPEPWEWPRDLPAAIPTPEEELSRRGLDRPVREALSQLPLRFRRTFLLAEVLGYSHKEVAAACGVPTGTVMSRLFRARRFLRRALGRDSGGQANGNGGPHHPVGQASNGARATVASGRTGASRRRVRERASDAAHPVLVAALSTPHDGREWQGRSYR